MENRNQPIAPAYFRQTGEDSFRLATDKDQREATYLVAYTGLTKREYAAIHCNEPAPPGWTPEFRKPPRRPKRFSELFGKQSEHPNKEYWQLWNDEEERFVAEEDIGSPITQTYWDNNKVSIEQIPESLKIEIKRLKIRWKKYFSKNAIWEKEYEAARIKQWRYYFADVLLSEK